MKSLHILFEDDNIIAVDKPSGILSIPSRNLDEKRDVLTYLRGKYPDIMVVHRIDRDTSGVMFFAKNEKSHRELSILFEKRTIHKEYLALLKGVPIVVKDKIDNFLEENPNNKGTYRVAYKDKGKRAISNYKVIEKFKNASLVSFQIETGRTHQIRVHAAHLSCPLAYDELYNQSNGIFVSKLKSKYKPSSKEERPIIQRLSLHAHKLSFVHPFTNENIEIISSLPKDMEKAIRILKKYS